jgi:hypothetical protein
MVDNNIISEVDASLDKKQSGYALYIHPDGHLFIGTGQHGRRLHECMFKMLIGAVDGSEKPSHRACGGNEDPPCGDDG